MDDEAFPLSRCDHYMHVEYTTTESIHLQTFIRTTNGRISLRNTGLSMAHLSGTSQSVTDTVGKIVKTARFLHKYLCGNTQRERSFLAFDDAIISSVSNHTWRYMVPHRVNYSCSLSVDMYVRTVA